MSIQVGEWTGIYTYGPPDHKNGDIFKFDEAIPIEVQIKVGDVLRYMNEYEFKILEVKDNLVRMWGPTPIKDK
jgi:hypothetical protein